MDTTAPSVGDAVRTCSRLISHSSSVRKLNATLCSASCRLPAPLLLLRDRRISVSTVFTGTSDEQCSPAAGALRRAPVCEGAILSHGHALSSP